MPTSKKRVKKPSREPVDEAAAEAHGTPVPKEPGFGFAAARRQGGKPPPAPPPKMMRSRGANRGR